MSNTKKIALMSTLVLLLALTAIFNFVLAGTQTVASGVATEEKATFFTMHRATRNTTRSEEFIQLDSIIATNAEGSAEYIAALQRKQELVKLMEDELVMETIIKAIGFSDAAVTITCADNINVFVNSNELTDDHITRIFYALEVEYNVRNGNVIIMPVYAES